MDCQVWELINFLFSTKAAKPSPLLRVLERQQKDGPRVWTHAKTLRDSYEAPGSGLATTALWGVRQFIEDLFLSNFDL